MHAFPIRNDEDLARAVTLIDVLWDARPGTSEHDLLQVMAELADAYEARHTSLPAGDPRALITYKMREHDWSQRELARRLGWGSGRVSEVLSGKRRITMSMVSELSRVLEIPPGLLVADTADEGGGRWVWVPAPLTASPARAGGERA